MQPLAWLRVLLAILAPLSGISPCVMPVLPPHTIGQSSAALFDAEGTVLNNMASVAIQCVAGYIQEEPTDANGISYEYVCPPQLATGEEDTENFRIPNPSCVPCPIGTYSSVIGLTADCTPCPAHSTTRTAGESRAYHGNMTNVRFCCYRDSTCSPSSGATAIDKCLCEEGHTGLVVNAASECKPCNPHTHKSGLGSRACRFTEQYSPTCQACIVDECKDTVAMMEECSSDLSEGAMNNISAALASCFTTFELQEAHLVSVTDNARCSSTCQTMLDCRHDCLTSSACKEDRALYTEDGVVRWCVSHSAIFCITRIDFVAS
eukprot:SAG11_NODE_603_length_8247_cov_13.668385_4_plen_320_part_00